MNINQLSSWLDEHGEFDGSPWIEWFDKEYCKKCEPEFAYIESLNGKHECGWCEIHKKCKYFKNLDDVPSNKEIIKMWLGLESEV